MKTVRLNKALFNKAVIVSTTSFPDPTATYQVECLHENAKIAYRASFFTSEVDKVKHYQGITLFIHLPNPKSLCENSVNRSRLLGQKR